MADGEGFPYLIPLIWQGDGSAISPNYSTRASLYGASSLPTGVWGGTTNVVGGGGAVLGNYTNAYNSLVGISSHISIDLSFTITGNVLRANADIDGSIPTSEMNNTNVIFIITYNRDDIQSGNYFASVSAYHAQPYNASTSRYTQDITLNEAWDHTKARLVAIVQNIAGTTPTSNRRIFNAATQVLCDIFPARNLRSYQNSQQIGIVWDEPESSSNLLGYHLYRNDVILNDTLLTVRQYIDDDIVPGIAYTYKLATVHAGGEASFQPTIVVTPPPQGTTQLGSGNATNGGTDAGPINVYYRSLRGQFIYTAQELNLAGVHGPTDIQSLGFFVSQAPAHSLPDFTIRIKPTSATKPITHDNGPWAVTHTMPQNYQPIAGDWRMIELSTAFHWDGVSNILIDTAFAPVPNFHSSGQVRIINELNGYRYAVSDNASMLNATTSTMANYKPQLRLVVESCEATENEPPSNLAAVIGNSHDFVRLSWRVGCSISLASGYHIYRDGEPITTTPVTGHIYDDMSLIESGDYLYTVTALYGSTQSEHSAEVGIRIDLHPHIPENFVATLQSTPPGSVRLTWHPPAVFTERLIGYNVYRDSKKLNTTIITSRNFTDTTITQTGTYDYTVTALYPYGESIPSTPSSVTIEVSDIDETLPLRVNALSGNYPNPFNPTTTIYFDIAQSSHVTIDVFNAKGQHVTTLTDHYYEAGRHYIVWDGKDSLHHDMPSGIYIYQMNTGSFVESKKMILLK
jgi:hypothetical protein